MRPCSYESEGNGWERKEGGGGGGGNKVGLLREGRRGKEPVPGEPGERQDSTTSSAFFLLLVEK